jgi:hypothetical protein
MQNAYAHNKAKRSGEAERSGEGGFGGLPLLRNNTTRPRAQQAKGNRDGGFLGLQCNTTRHEATASATSKFSALGTPAKPNQDMLRNALLCSLAHHFYVKILIQKQRQWKDLSKPV